MPPTVSPSTSLYTLGRGVISLGEWNGATPPAAYKDVGNCPMFEVEVTEETLDHFSSRGGLKVKDKQVILETGYTVKFQLDEMSLYNLKVLLKATLSGGNVLLANTVSNAEFSIKFISDNAVGENQKWEFWRLKLKPGSAFSLIGDEWTILEFEGEGLADVTNHVTSPYFTVTYETTTSTTSSSSTTSTTN